MKWAHSKRFTCHRKNPYDRYYMHDPVLKMAQPGGGGAPLIPALRWQKQVDLLIFEAILVYRVSSRNARATQRNPVSKQTISTTTKGGGGGGRRKEGKENDWRNWK